MELKKIGKGMLEKEYYEVEDIVQSGLLTNSDILYLLERQELPLIFFRKDSLFYLGTGERHNFIGHCHAFYSGLVEIEQAFDEDLIEVGFVETDFCKLLESDRVEVIESSCPEAVKPPNSVFLDWTPQQILPSNVDKFGAIEKLKKTKFSCGENTIDFNIEYKLDNSDSTIYFSRNPQKYELTKLKVKRETLQRLGVLKSNNNNSESLPEEKAVSDDIEKINLMKDGLDRILARVIIANNNPSLEVIWRILKNDFELDKQEYDVEMILIDVTNNELRYTTHTNSDKTIQKSTVQQHLGRVRGVLGRNRR